MKLAVSEFFYSIQGEGMSAGRPSVFLRLGGCNLMCGGMGTQFDGELHNDATWRCDTIEVWMNAKSKSFDEVLDDVCLLALHNGARLVITGGEPLMQAQGMERYILYVRERVGNVFVEVETNGTITPTDGLIRLVNQWNVSPKLPSSGNSINQCKNLWAIGVFNGLQNVQFKFVVSNEQDWKEVQEHYRVDREKIWLMPAGANQEQLSVTRPIVAEICKDNHLNFTDRMHVSIWNKKTGV